MQTPFTADDLYLHNKVTDIQFSPDGNTLVYSVRSVDREEDRYRHTIWSVPVDGGAAVQLSEAMTGQDQSPHWSPDGKTLAFLSSRSSSTQIFLLPKAGGEASQISNFPGGVSDFAWTPDGRSMIVSSAVTVDADLHGKRPSAAIVSRSCTPEVAWKLPYKSDEAGYLLGREIRLFSLDIHSGVHSQLMEGAFDILGFDISPDGRQIAYSRTRAGRFTNCSELWVCDITGQESRALVRDVATVATPVWSPDGKWIVFTGGAREGEGESTLWLHEVATGKTTLFDTHDIEFAAGTTPSWSRDGSNVIFCQAHRGRHRIVSGRLDDRSLEVLAAGDRQFSAFSSNQDKLAYSIDSPVLPSELWTCTAGQADERQLTDMNPWWRERIAMHAEMRSFQVPDGNGGTEEVEGWLLRSADASGATPLLNDVHGGPAAYALMDFDSNVFWQSLCSMGWSVLALNAAGSASYGRTFSERLTGRWGELDLPQHMAAIESLRQEGICDDRLAISGKSYGGFMSAWTIGHTDTFRAAVVMSPPANLESHYGTSDGGYYADPFYLGTPSVFNRNAARLMSPLHYVAKATTPTLFMHGKDDERCPKGQSEELFVSLMRAGDTPTELVLYPGENHGFLGKGKPSCRADAAERIIDWVTRHACR